MREGARFFPVLAFDLIRECYTLWRLLSLDYASCEGFSTLGNAVVTSQEHAAKTEVVYNLLGGMNCLAMNRLAMGTVSCMVLQPFSSFAEHGLHVYTLPPPWWTHIDSQTTGSRLIMGQQMTLQMPSMGTHGQGWVANRTQYIFSPEMSSHECDCTGHRSLATHSQVISIAGLCSDYTFRSGLQPQEIWLGTPESSQWSGTPWT